MIFFPSNLGYDGLMNFVYNVLLQQLKWVSKPLISYICEKTELLIYLMWKYDFDLVVEFGKKI
jgi:hypothetical protein